MLLKLFSIFVNFFSLSIITMYFWRTGKYLKKGGHQRCLGVCPICPPPDSFFQQGQKHTISNFRGGILTGGICPTCFETGGAYAHCAPRLRTPLNKFGTLLKNIVHNPLQCNKFTIHIFLNIYYILHIIIL